MGKFKDELIYQWRMIPDKLGIMRKNVYRWLANRLPKRFVEMVYIRVIDHAITGYVYDLTAMDALNQWTDQYERKKPREEPKAVVLADDPTIFETCAKCRTPEKCERLRECIDAGY